MKKVTEADPCSGPMTVFLNQSGITYLRINFFNGQVSSVTFGKYVAFKKKTKEKRYLLVSTFGLDY